MLKYFSAIKQCQFLPNKYKNFQKAIGFHPEKNVFI